MAAYMSTPQQNTWGTRYCGWGGLNVEDLDYKIGSTQSPDVLNVRIKNGIFGKRKGQEWYSDELETVYSMFVFKGTLYIHAGEHFYKQTGVIEDKGVFEQIGSVSAQKGQFFAFNNHLYYLNGIDYKTLKDDSFEDVEPYIPNIIINRAAGKEDGTLTNNYNRLGSGFKNSFHGDGTETKFILTTKKLDETPLKATVDGEEKEEETDFTVDRETGIVTFNEAPADGTNNVVITAYKTDQEYINSIKKCKFAISYGGENNSRIFIGGSGANYYFSDVLDPTYFPEQNYSPVGNNSGDITGFGEQYDVLVVFTDRETYGVEYQLKDDGTAYFTQVLINGRVGCDCPNTIQLIQNRLTWLTTYDGVCTMVSTAIEDERNIMPISRNINPRLLSEVNLKQAITIDYDENYMICVNGNAYSWNYGVSPYSHTGNTVEDARSLAWFFYDNIKASCFVETDKEVLHGRDNRVVKFTEILSDFGQAINARYRTPALDFERIDYLKTISKMFVSVRGDVASRINITYMYDDNDKEEERPLVLAGSLWDSLSMDTFSIEGNVRYAQTFMRKCKVKKVRNFSVLFYNNDDNQDMNLSEIMLYYTYAKRDKGG